MAINATRNGGTMEPMGTIRTAVLATALLTAACTSSPHYHRAYTPTAGKSAGSVDMLYSRAVSTMTDRGLTPATNDRAAGIVVSEWVCSSASSDCMSRYRIRVAVYEGGWDIAINCQRHDDSTAAIMTGDKTYVDCNSDDTRPQMMLDHQAAIGAAMGGQ